MARGIYKALNIESGEATNVFILIFQSVFLGIFYGTFDISAHALFLEVYPADMIPKAYIISGIAGILMTSVYSFFQSRIRFSIFAIINLVIVAGLTALMRFGYVLTSQERIVFVIFVMMGPLNILALLGFWGTTGRIFTLRQGKRLFGMIDTGQIIGIIISSYAIPVLLSFEFETRNLLLISAVSIVVALLIQFFVSGRIPREKASREPATEKVRGASFLSTLKDRYILYMSTFVILLVIVTFFVHFTFITVSKENYPDHVDFAAFLGYFNGTLMIFSVILKTFVYSKIMKTYGLRLTLAITPFLILLFTIIAAIVGGFFGYSVGAAAFTLFFLLLSVSKLFTKALQDSMVAPSMKILYQSLDSRIRYAVQARIDGTVNEIAALASGLILAGLGALAFIEIIHFTYVLAGFLVLWLLVALGLYTDYKRSLNSSLAKFREASTTEEEKLPSDFIISELKKGTPVHILNAIKITEYISFRHFKNTLIDLIGNASKHVSNFSLKKIHENLFLDRKDEISSKLKGTSSKENKELIRELIKSMSDERLAGVRDDDLALLIKSVNPEDRIAVATYMFQAKEFKHLPLLNTLLRDHDPDVRKAAIDVAVKWKVSDTVPIMIDYLNTPLYDRAYEALIDIGETGLEGIEQAFFKSGIDELVLRRLTRILGEIASPKALEILLEKTGHYNKDVALQALQSLTLCKYQADEENINKIALTVRHIISVLAWNLAAEFTINEHTLGKHLEKAISEEITSNFDQMYHLLSIAYDSSSIYHIRQNLESGTSEGIGFAIELLDLFIAEELKPVLFPVLDDTNIVEKIKQLQVEFPIEILEPKELLLSIIDRDPNYINAYTKACALYEMDKLEEFEISQDLIAQVFNPDLILAELAAWQMRKLDPTVYEKLTVRLDQDARNNLNERLFALDSGRTELFIEIIFRLENLEYFASLQGNLILNLARNFEVVAIPEGQVLQLEPDKEKHIIAYVRKGTVSLVRADKELMTAAQDNLISSLPFLTVEGTGFKIKASSDTTLFTVDLYTLRKYMFDNNEFGVAVYNWMNDQIIHEKEFLNTIEMVS